MNSFVVKGQSLAFCRNLDQTSGGQTTFTHTHFQAVGDKSIIVDIISSHFVRRDTKALKFILIISLSDVRKHKGVTSLGIIGPALRLASINKIILKIPAARTCCKACLVF